MTNSKLLSPLLTALALTTALIAPGLAEAQPITLTTTMSSYGGRGAYLAYYMTDASGGYAGTLWLSGGKTRYYKHFTGWMRASGGDLTGLDGVTGASIGAGQTQAVTLDLPDALFDAGYKLHIDTAVEEMGQTAKDVSVPLTAAGIGQPVSGKGIISSFTYSN